MVIWLLASAGSWAVERVSMTVASSTLQHLWRLVYFLAVTGGPTRTPWHDTSWHRHWEHQQWPLGGGVAR